MKRPRRRSVLLVALSGLAVVGGTWALAPSYVLASDTAIEDAYGSPVIANTALKPDEFLRESSLDGLYEICPRPTVREAGRRDGLQCFVLGLE